MAKPPWCIGLGSGAATGWPATDWVEDIMLRTQPPEVYDAWVSNEMPFNDPRVINAVETFGTFALSDGWVQGGPGAVATTDFRDSPTGPLRLAAGLLHAPPGVVHPGLLSPKGPRWASMPISSTSPSFEGGGSRQSGAGRWYADGGDRSVRRDGGFHGLPADPLRA